MDYSQYNSVEKVEAFIHTLPRSVKECLQKSNAVIEHHFNNHEHCDDWCAMKNADTTQKALGELKYRCKKANPKMYEDLCLILKKFTDTDKLKDCHHGHSSQKNESMNRLISRYVPKDRTYCQSSSLSGRVCLAVGVDSVGVEKYYERLFHKMKIPFASNNQQMLGAMDNKRNYDRAYQAQASRKRKRSILKFDNIRDGFLKQKADEAVGLAYKRGMNIEETGGDGKPTAKVLVCKFGQ